jgi:hypothetical protein
MKIWEGSSKIVAWTVAGSPGGVRAEGAEIPLHSARGLVVS